MMARAKELRAAKAGRRRGRCTARPSSDVLVELAPLKARLLHDRDGTPYAEIEVDGHKEFWAINSLSFKRWLRGEYFAATRSGAGADTMSTALATIDALAVHEGGLCQVYRRVAALGDRIYVDLCNDAWGGRRDHGRGRARLARGARVLRAVARHAAPAAPRAGGGPHADLGRLLNADGDGLILIGGFLLGMLTAGPYPLLSLRGEAGPPRRAPPLSSAT
jgi:hypothetical protein